MMFEDFSSLIFENLIGDFFSVIIGLALIYYGISNIIKGYRIEKPKKIKTPYGVRYLATYIIETATGGYLRPFMKTEEAEEIIARRNEYIFKRGLSALGSSAVITIPSKIASLYIPIVNTLPQYNIVSSVYISLPVMTSSMILTTLIALIYRILSK